MENSPSWRMVRREKNMLRKRRSIEILESRRLLTADLDGSGRVDFADFLILSGAYGGPAEFGTGADIDGDGIVGFGDFTILSANFGASDIEFETIPFMEPSNPEPFQAVVTSTEEWHALTRQSNPESSPSEPPVALDEFMLVFASIGETGLGEWVQMEWVLQGANEIEVGYRSYLGGVKPPPGTHVSSELIAVPASELPVRFMELTTIPLP